MLVLDFPIEDKFGVDNHKPVCRILCWNTFVIPYNSVSCLEI